MRPRWIPGEGVWCPRCESWKSEKAFHHAPHRRGAPFRTYCIACEQEYKRLALYRAAMTDPQKHRNMVAAQKPARDRQNAKRVARRTESHRERTELFCAATNFLLSRGFLISHICRLTGVDRESIARWRAGRGFQFHIYERIMTLYTLSANLPPRKPSVNHPSYAVLQQRMMHAPQESPHGIR